MITRKIVVLILGAEKIRNISELVAQLICAARRSGVQVQSVVVDHQDSYDLLRLAATFGSIKCVAGSPWEVIQQVAMWLSTADELQVHSPSGLLFPVHIRTVNINFSEAV